MSSTKVFINVTASDEGSSSEEVTSTVDEEDDDHSLSSVAEGSVVVKEEKVNDDEAVPCTLCSQVPCDRESSCEEIWEECELLKGQGADNKQVRFHAYKMYTHLRHGVLH
jgi:hypothetical protein